jgi:quinol monooxygenase YgiN
MPGPAARDVLHGVPQRARILPVTCAGGSGAHVERIVLGTIAMVRLTISFTAPSARSAQDLLDAIRFLVLGARLEPGCHGSNAWADPDYTVHYVEEWTTEADLRRRVRSDEFTSLLGIVDSAREPRVQFDFISSSRGLDYVAEIRGVLDSLAAASDAVLQRETER